MSVAPTVSYPGVYIQEVPSDVRTIVGVDTATTAFVGRANRGPIGVPTVINNYGDFERIYGGLWLSSSLGYAVSDFYLNGGSKAVIVRLYEIGQTKEWLAGANSVASALVAKVYATNEDVVAALAADSTDWELAGDAADAVATAVNSADVTNHGSAVDAATTAVEAFRVPGPSQDAANAVLAAVSAVSTIGDAKTTATETATDYANVAATARAIRDAAAGAADIQSAIADATAAVDAASPGSSDLMTAALAEITDQLASLTPAADAAELVTTATAIANAIPAAEDEEKSGADAAAQAASGAASEATASTVSVADAVQAFVPRARSRFKIHPQSEIVVEAADPGAWGNELRSRITDNSDLDPNISQAIARQFGFASDQSGQLFNLEIYDGNTGEIEFFPNLTVIDGPRRLNNVLRNESRLVSVLNHELSDDDTRPSAHSDPDDPDDTWVDGSGASSGVAPTGGATDGSRLNDNSFTIGQDTKDGIYALDDADIFNLLCIPPYDGDDVSSMKDVNPAAVLAKAAKYCKDQRAMLIVDPPFDPPNGATHSGWKTKKDAVDNFPIPGLQPSENAAVYFPRIKKPNPLRDSRIEEFVPCGAIAGIMARTDATRGVWKAPAGLDASLTGVVELSVPLTDAENGELNPLGVNCLRQLPAAGNVVWGARTIVGDDRLASQWKYIPVRRTALFIEETIYRNIQWAVFEPNDEPLWSQLRLNIGVFMNGLFRQGAFQGGSPKDAYFVKCDATTTTQADIDRGIVNVIVGFAPLKPAEFVIVYIQQIAGNLEE